MTRQTLLFDLDDTLIHCNKYFILTIKKFANQMKDWFAEHRIDIRKLKQKQLELDLIGIQQHGFLKERFPESLVETYHYYAAHTGRPVDPRETEYLYQLGNSVYEYEYEPYPDMEKTLQDLQGRGHQLYLYTGGDVEVQTAKVKQLKLERYFADRVFISRHKSTDALERILNRFGLDRETTWMIGNSARTDALPALEAGIHCIHIPCEKDWEFNTIHIDIEPKGVFVQLGSLKEVPRTIDRYIQNK